jgi:hypothetical protein
VLVPIHTFSPYVSDFWFVDTEYFRRCPPEQRRPVLSEKCGYNLLDSQIRFPEIPDAEWMNDDRYGRERPPILSETYQHIATERVIRIHRHRRRGPSALRTEIDRLGVFFYRGDSDAGGSCTQWLTVREWHKAKKRKRRWLIHEVLDKIVDGGLIVTDGSMCKGDHNPYREFRRLHCNRDISAIEAVASVQPFTDDRGHSFTCIGCLGQHHHYGPTMVWQMTRALG